MTVEKHWLQPFFSYHFVSTLNVASRHQQKGTAKEGRSWLDGVASLRCGEARRPWKYDTRDGTTERQTSEPAIRGSGCYFENFIWHQCNYTSTLSICSYEWCSPLQSLNNHKKDFERLLGEASTLVIILWQLYIELKAKYHSLGWPPPKLKNLLDELVEYVVCPSEWYKTFTLVYSTTCHIHKLMGRKSEKNPVKRVLLGCFGIRDLGKLNIYQRRLGIMALCLQVTTQLHRPV